MADGIVSISRDNVRIGNRQYKTTEEIEPSVLELIRLEIGEFLPPGETRARAVAEAICQLHACAMSACLAE